MIAVFDTNVLIAAIIMEGVCSKLLRRARTKEFHLISCPFIITEIRHILSKKFHLSREEVDSAIEPLNDAITQIIDHRLKITKICKDDDDDNVLACAIAEKAGYLVTGDSDLLKITRGLGIKIMTPRDFEKLFDQ
jgi:putative PIN family toxin of toxin-antitoxin system